MGNQYDGLMFPVKTTVVEGCGPTCRVRHEAGQFWFMRSTPPGICSFAFNAIFPAYWTLRFGGIDPGESDPDVMHVGCSVKGCNAQFRVERISEDEAGELLAQADMITIDDLLSTFPQGLSRMSEST